MLSGPHQGGLGVWGDSQQGQKVHLRYASQMFCMHHRLLLGWKGGCQQVLDFLRRE